MAYYNKIGLLILNQDNTKFLVCQKSPDDVTADYIMPNGQFEEDTIKECLKNEIKEELNCEVDFNTLEYIGEYIDVAAGKPNKDVSIKLYKSKIISNPEPSGEVKNIYFISKEDQNNFKASSIIRNKIIPDLIQKKILK